MKNKPRKGLFFLPKHRRTREHMLCALLARNALPVCNRTLAKGASEQRNTQQYGYTNGIGDQQTSKREPPNIFFV